MRGYYCLLALSACNLATLDPEALVAERTPIGARDCGAASWWADRPPAPVRTCVLDAMADGDPFFAIADEGVADGRFTIGYASDGASFMMLDYEAVYGQWPGTDTEDVQWWQCTWLESHGADCPTLTRDLCLGCVGATPLP